MPTAPSTVTQVIRRLRSIERELPPDDGAAVFNRVYLTVTERIAAQLEGGGVFADPDFMAELDVRFASFWLRAYDAVTAERRPSSAWAPLFEDRRSRGVLPIQFALAGINAHIENDLPLAMVETCLSRAVTPRRRSVKEDYQAVNRVLASVEAEIRRSFLTDLERWVDEEVGPVVHLISAWKIDKARDLAWVTVEALWASRRIERLYAASVDALSHTVGLGSRLLLTPVALGLP